MGAGENEVHSCGQIELGHFFEGEVPELDLVVGVEELVVPRVRVSSEVYHPHVELVSVCEEVRGGDFRSIEDEVLARLNQTVQEQQRLLLLLCVLLVCRILPTVDSK